MGNLRIENATLASSPRRKTHSLIPKFRAPCEQQRLTVLDYLSITFPLWCVNPFCFEIKKPFRKARNCTAWNWSLLLSGCLLVFHLFPPWMYSGWSFFGRDSFIPQSCWRQGLCTLCQHVWGLVCMGSKALPPPLITWQGLFSSSNLWGETQGASWTFQPWPHHFLLLI